MNSAARGMAAMVGATIEVSVLGMRMGRSPEQIADFLGTLFLGGLLGFARG